MTHRAAAAFVPVLLLAGAAPAFAADGIKPRRGTVLTGQIQFPREQAMRIETGARDGSKLTVRMGFHGRCTGGTLREAWASDVRSRPTVRVRDGRFRRTLRATVPDIGNVPGRNGEFKWRLTGRFVEKDVVRASVSGTAVIRGRDGRVVARCKIAKRTSARLAAS